MGTTDSRKSMNRSVSFASDVSGGDDDDDGGGDDAEGGGEPRLS